MSLPGLWGQHIDFPQGRIMVRESSSGSPGLADEVSDNPSPSWAFPSTFPFLWHWTRALCYASWQPASSDQPKDTGPRDLLREHVASQRFWWRNPCWQDRLPAEQLSSGFLALWLSTDGSWKGQGSSQEAGPCKGFCPFPPLPLWGAGNNKCGGEEQGSSLCHFTRFVTLHKLFFNCSFLICKHEIRILRPQTVGTR